MSIDQLAKNLINKDGIWYNKTKAAVSFPDDGNETCFQLEENSFWFKYRNKFILEAIKNYPPNGVFFDVGGGNGFVTKAVEDSGIEVVLVEPGETGCINARNRNIKNIICSSFENIDFEENVIASIGVFDVVEHIQNDIAFLKSLNRYLRKDGLLYITVPAYNMLWSFEDDNAGHFNRYTLRSLTKRLEDSGFKVLYATYFFSILTLPIFISRTIRGKFRINKKLSVSGKKREHKSENPILNKIWTWEWKRIKQNKTIPFGSSCLVVARKK